MVEIQGVLCIIIQSYAHTHIEDLVARGNTYTLYTYMTYCTVHITIPIDSTTYKKTDTITCIIEPYTTLALLTHYKNNIDVYKKGLCIVGCLLLFTHMH